jgi:hypothetical protein
MLKLSYKDEFSSLHMKWKNEERPRKRHPHWRVLSSNWFQKTKNNIVFNHVYLAFSNTTIHYY